jgi:Mrp family chromosome partitioning ATPase
MVIGAGGPALRSRHHPPRPVRNGRLKARGLRIAILDADFNGPSQARMAGVQGALFVPGSHKVALPRTRNGIAVFSMGSLVPESEALEFESAAHGESHTWRATREFALLGEILGSFEWERSIC